MLDFGLQSNPPCFLRVIMKKLVLALCILVFSTSTFACYKYKRGASWGKLKLIESSNSIYLVELSSIETRDFNSKYSFTVIEKLRGVSNVVEPIYQKEFISKHSDLDFNRHQDSVFWDKEVGRSGDIGGANCMPAHVFKPGFRYLLFRDSIGASMSAEVVNSESDKWLQFVRGNLTKAK